LPSPSKGCKVGISVRPPKLSISSHAHMRCRGMGSFDQAETTRRQLSECMFLRIVQAACFRTRYEESDRYKPNTKSKSVGCHESSKECKAVSLVLSSAVLTKSIIFSCASVSPRLAHASIAERTTKAMGSRRRRRTVSEAMFPQGLMPMASTAERLKRQSEECAKSTRIVKASGSLFFAKAAIAAQALGPGDPTVSRSSATEASRGIGKPFNVIRGYYGPTTGGLQAELSVGVHIGMCALPCVHPAMV